MRDPTDPTVELDNELDSLDGRIFKKEIRLIILHICNIVLPYKD